MLYPEPVRLADYELGQSAAEFLEGEVLRLGSRRQKAGLSPFIGRTPRDPGLNHSESASLAGQVELHQYPL
jgi:hypothetical protein